MDLKLKYEELWDLIKQLPAQQLTRLKEDLAAWTSKKKENHPNEFQAFLLSGPTLTDDQDQQFQENRKYVNEWMNR
jgi:hypothetical protein